MNRAVLIEAGSQIQAGGSDSIVLIQAAGFYYRKYGRPKQNEVNILVHIFVAQDLSLGETFHHFRNLSKNRQFGFIVTRHLSNCWSLRLPTHCHKQSNAHCILVLASLSTSRVKNIISKGTSE